ncbi:MAG: UDP-glucose 4-epimerase GalE [Nocardioidaceae bacterium]
MKILVTGGAGYIGSITCTALERAGHSPVVLDSLVCGRREFVQGRPFYEGDIGDRALIARIVDEHPDLALTIHMAARISVPESVALPYTYYRDNIAKSLEMFDELVSRGKPRIVFSSTASLYDVSPDFEVTEESPLSPQSPYAKTKRVIEMALEDMAQVTDLRAIILRYFNPLGSDPELRSGVYDREPGNVIGQLLLAATGDRAAFTITGVDHPTRDGTGLRDYVHVWDVALAHVAAVEKFDEALDAVGAATTIMNIGTGEGVTVRELLSAFEDVSAKKVPVREAPPRPGDAVGAFANVDKAQELLGWSSQLTLPEAIASSLEWFHRRRDVLGYA